MTICRIEGCLHRVHRSASPTVHIGKSWYDYGICSCCGIEFCPEEEYRPSQTCNRLLREQGFIIHPIYSNLS